MTQNNAPSDSKADKLDYFNSARVSIWECMWDLEINEISVFIVKTSLSLSGG